MSQNGKLLNTDNKNQW